MDTWYKSKLQDLNDASTKHAETIRSLREEIAGYRKKVSRIYLSGFRVGSIVL